MKRPKYCSKETIERLAKPLRINKIEKAKDNNIKTDNNLINIKLKKTKSKEKNKHGKIIKSKKKKI